MVKTSILLPRKYSGPAPADAKTGPEYYIPIMDANDPQYPLETIP